MRILLAVLLWTATANAYTISGGESDTSNTLWWFIPAAGCVSTTASSNWDMIGNDVPVATCVDGTNVDKGVLTFNDGSGTNIVAPSIQQTLLTPISPSPATLGYVTNAPITVTLMWYAAATTLETRWCAAVVCRADAETDDGAAFDTAVCVEDTAKGTTLQNNLVTITLPTGSTDTCANSELLHLKVYRDSDNAGDDMSGDANLVAATVAWQRAQ
jgi:hypothetical protein